MKIKIDKQTSRTPLIVAVIVFLLLCAYFGIALKTHFWPFLASTNTQNTTSESSPSTDSTGKTQTDTTGVKSGVTSDQVPVSTSIAASITQLSEDDNNNITFAGLIKNNTSPGTCVVTFTNPNAKPYVVQADSTTKDSQTLCGPLSISALNFSYLGEWAVNLRFYSDNEQATADSTITIQ